MKMRCKGDAFTLDPAWLVFRDFLRDMGPIPGPEHSIDRTDTTNRRYGPGLCRWATKKEQTVNRSNTRLVDFEGERITLQEFSARLGMKYSTVHSKLERGETPSEIAAVKRSPDASGNYRPIRMEGDDAKFSVWRAQYADWLKRRVRPDARSSAPPELFDIISVSLALDNALKRLESPAFEELTTEEYVTQADRWMQERRIAQHAPEWIIYARERLAAREPALARNFVLRPGISYRDFWRYEGNLQPKERPER
jgi:hypothetical protein